MQENSRVFIFALARMNNEMSLMTIVLHNKNEQFVSLMTLFRCSQIILPSLTSGLFPLNDHSMINPFSSSQTRCLFPYLRSFNILQVFDDQPILFLLSFCAISYFQTLIWLPYFVRYFFAYLYFLLIFVLFFHWDSVLFVHGTRAANNDSFV
jgi:hypothetical protein